MQWLLTSVQINDLVYKTWFSRRYPQCWYIIHDNRSEFKHFHALCDTYGIKHKSTSVRNTQVNAMLEHIHAVVTNMLCTSEINLANLSVKTRDTNVFFLSDTARVTCSTYHTVLKASPGAAIFWQDMLFDIPFIAHWRKIEEHRQKLADLTTTQDNEGQIG
jgi:hypothetical protein